MAPIGPPKYEPLRAHLAGQPADVAAMTLTIAELGAVLGFALPAGARDTRWWANNATARPQVRAWREAGWRARLHVRMGRVRAVTFVRVDTTDDPVASDGL